MVGSRYVETMASFPHCIPGRLSLARSDPEAAETPTLTELAGSDSWSLSPSDVGSFHHP